MAEILPKWQDKPQVVNKASTPTLRQVFKSPWKLMVFGLGCLVSLHLFSRMLRGSIIRRSTEIPAQSMSSDGLDDVYNSTLGVIYSSSHGKAVFEANKIITVSEGFRYWVCRTDRQARCKNSCIVIYRY